MKAIWKDIPGYEGRYKVSDTGIVRSYSTLQVNVMTKGFSRKRGKKLKTWISKGYHRVGLTVNNKHRFFSVHRLVAMTFIPLIEGKNIINHIDGNRYNNNVSNLEWCTQKENMHHSLYILKREPNGSKKVINTETGEQYPSIKKAHKALNFSYSISKTKDMLSGKSTNTTHLKLLK